MVRAGIILNPKSHHNQRSKTGVRMPFATGALVAVPDSLAELGDTLRQFEREKIDLLVIDGGDGTIRDVLTAARGLWPDGLPHVALVPSGKTNARGGSGCVGPWSSDGPVAARNSVGSCSARGCS